MKAILTNERYTGDMLLQKTYIENCITKKVKVNRGEMPKYLITNNHPAIISKETFKKVQAEFARRGGKRKTSSLNITEKGKYSGKYALTETLICGECGSPYRRKTWIINGEKKRFWRCLNRVEHGLKFCSKSISIEENKLHRAILNGIRQAFEYSKETSALLISGLSYALTGDDNILDTFAVEQKIKNLNQDMEDLIMISMRTDGNNERYESEIHKISGQLCSLREQLEIVRNNASANNVAEREVVNIKDLLKNEELNFTEYSDILVRRLIECIRVMSDNKLIIIFNGGAQVEVEFE